MTGHGVLAGGVNDACIFVLHSSIGLILLLIWVDDILLAFNSKDLYNEFVTLYSARFPSKHHLGCVKFAGLSIDYQLGSSLTVHQRPHIELAFNKFIIDKPAGLRSPAVSRIAIHDRDSPFHYSKLALAANDEERTKMKSKPYLSALATMLYVGFWSLPHIVYHCSHLGQFMHDPSPAALEALMNVIVYTYANRDIDMVNVTLHE